MPPFERFEVVVGNPCQFVVAIKRRIDITDDSEAQRAFIEQAIREALEGEWKDCATPPDSAREVEFLVPTGRTYVRLLGSYIEERWIDDSDSYWDNVAFWRDCTPLPSVPLSEGAPCKK